MNLFSKTNKITFRTLVVGLNKLDVLSCLHFVCIFPNCESKYHIFKWIKRPFIITIHPLCLMDLLVQRPNASLCLLSPCVKGVRHTMQLKLSFAWKLLCLIKVTMHNNWCLNAHWQHHQWWAYLGCEYDNIDLQELWRAL